MRSYKPDPFLDSKLNSAMQESSIMHFEQKLKIEEESSQEGSFKMQGDQEKILEEGFLANRPSISIES